MIRIEQAENIARCNALAKVFILLARLIVTEENRANSSVEEILPHPTVVFKDTC